VRRLAVLLAVLAAPALPACGGSDPGPAGGAAPDTPAPVVAGGASAKQEEFRQRLLAQIESGTYPECDCTAAVRAKDRVQTGQAKAPDPDRLVSSLP
jgi:hypothetical protein